MQPLTSLIATLSVMYYDYYMYIYMHTCLTFPQSLHISYTKLMSYIPTIILYTLIPLSLMHIIITHLTHKTLITYLRPPIKHFISYTPTRVT